MISAQLESLKATLEELKPLLPRRFEDLSLNKEKVPLDPQCDIYCEMELRRQVLFVAALGQKNAVCFVCCCHHPS